MSYQVGCQGTIDLYLRSEDVERESLGAVWVVCLILPERMPNAYTVLLFVDYG